MVIGTSELLTGSGKDSWHVMCGRSKMGEGLQRFLKLERGVLPIFRQRESETPIMLPAFWCDAEPAFCGEMLV
jgi:hypothetical protein